MPGFVITLQTMNGTVIAVDDETSSDRISGIYKINEYNVAIILFEYKQAVDFCNEHLKKFSSGGNFNDIVKTAINALQQTQQKYLDKAFSIVFASVDPRGFSSAWHAIWMQNNVPQSSPVTSAGVYGAAYQDLCEYIVSKTYSKYMSLNETIDLVGYILLQCNKALRMENNVDIVTLSPKGIEKLGSEKLISIISKAESVDNVLKKDFSDFFITLQEKN